jgi:hypothetical protein
VIFMHRDFREIVASQNKMLVRRGEPVDGNDARTIELYKNHLRKVALQLNDSPNFAVLDVDYRHALESPREHAERVRRFLGADLDVERMSAVVDRELYRNRA